MGVIRYVGLGGTTKRLSAGEYANLKANGVLVLLVAELDTHDAEAGYSGGVANANAALADARAIGVADADIFIFCAADEHLSAGQIPTAVAYAKGFQDVLGQGRTGPYGFAEYVDAVHAAGIGSAYWKCGAAPTPGETWVTFWQRNSGQTSQTINHVIVDINDQLTALAIGDDLTPEQDARLAQVLANTQAILTEQTGGQAPGQVPGWPSKVDPNVKMSELDFVRYIDLNVHNTQVAVGQVAANVDAVLAAVKTGGVDPAVLTAAVQTAVQAAVKGLSLSVSPADQLAIAEVVAKTLGSKLTA